MSLNVAIVGKPNVGKSTFFNKIFSSNISKVSDIPGTTKEVISKTINYENLEINILDTGGLKKKSKSQNSNQSFITRECLSAINKSSIIIFMIDASDDFTKNDKQICRMILNKLKTLIVIVNKSDLIRDKITQKTNYFDYYFKNLFSDILIKPFFYSSLKSANVNFFLKEIKLLEESSGRLINNKELNQFLKLVNNTHKAPHKGNFRPKIKFLRQVKSNPIILKAFGTRLSGINKEYKNFLIKKFLNYFNIFNRIAVIKFINNENPFN